MLLPCGVSNDLEGSGNRHDGDLSFRNQQQIKNGRLFHVKMDYFITHVKKIDKEHNYERHIERHFRPGFQ